MLKATLSDARLLFITNLGLDGCRFATLCELLGELAVLPDCRTIEVEQHDGNHKYDSNTRQNCSGYFQRVGAEVVIERIREHSTNTGWLRVLGVRRAAKQAYREHHGRNRYHPRKRVSCDS